MWILFLLVTGNYSNFPADFEPPLVLVCLKTSAASQQPPVGRVGSLPQASSVWVQQPPGFIMSLSDFSSYPSLQPTASFSVWRVPLSSRTPLVALPFAWDTFPGFCAWLALAWQCTLERPWLLLPALHFAALVAPAAPPHDSQAWPDFSRLGL